MSEVFKQVYGLFHPPKWDMAEDLEWLLSAKRKALGIPDDMLNSQLPYNGKTDPLFEVVKNCLLPVVNGNFDKFQDYIKAAKRFIFLLKDMSDNGWFDVHLLEEAYDTFLTISVSQRGPNIQNIRPTSWLYKEKKKED